MSLDRTKKKLGPTARQERRNMYKNFRGSKGLEIDVQKLTEADHANNPKLQLQKQKRSRVGDMQHASAEGVLPGPISREEHNSALLEIRNLKLEVNKLRKQNAHLSNTLGITISQVELYDVD